VKKLSRDYEELLREGLLTPPEDFVQRTMALVAAAVAPREQPTHPWVRDIAQWLALAGAALVGATQVVSYVFGIWMLSSVG
jgi:hypothetical protein